MFQVQGSLGTCPRMLWTPGGRMGPGPGALGTGAWPRLAPWPQLWSRGTQSRAETVSPTEQLGRLHCVPWGGDAASCQLPSGRSVHYVGLPRKTPAFREQEATIYHQENVGGAQAVPELAGRVGLIWMESPLSSALCSQSWKPWGPARPRAFPVSHWTLGLSHLGLTNDVGGDVREAFPLPVAAPWLGPLRERGSHIQDLPILSQSILSSHPPSWPTQSRPPHLPGEVHQPVPRCCHVGSFLN